MRLWSTAMNRMPSRPSASCIGRTLMVWAWWSSGAKVLESLKVPRDRERGNIIRSDDRKRRSFSPTFKRQEKPKRTFPEYDVKPDFSYTFSETAEEGEAILPTEREKDRSRDYMRESRERKKKRFERRSDSSSERSDRSRDKKRDKKIKKHKRDHS